MEKQITVQVPEERVPEFYEMFGRWLAKKLSPPAIDQGAQNAALANWAMEDLDKAATVYRKLSPYARKLFDMLMDDPERKFSGEDIAAAVGLRNGKHAVAGTLAWPGRHSYKVGRKFPIEYQEPTHDNDISLYWMTMDNASLFQAARKEVKGE